LTLESIQAQNEKVPGCIVG